jgi:hypothetical protein
VRDLRPDQDAIEKVGTAASRSQVPDLQQVLSALLKVPNDLGFNNLFYEFSTSLHERIDVVQDFLTGLVKNCQSRSEERSGFGRGFEGYVKRYTAAYASVLTRSLIVQVLLPSLFNQDPRYFYKGNGSTTSRIGYAISRAVIKKGDNGRWQPNYSGILGSLASGGLSNLYYPAEDRKGVRLTFENAAIGIGGAALGHLVQEFLFKKITSRARKAQRSYLAVPPT